MATRLYSINPEDSEFAVVEAVGSANVTKNIELTVNTSPTLMTDGNTASGSRQITREEVLLSIDKFKNWIEKQPWPPQST